MNHYQTIQLSQKAFALSVAATIYDQCCLEEQRILREHNRVLERLEKCRQDKFRYGQMIGVSL